MIVVGRDDRRGEIRVERKKEIREVSSGGVKWRKEGRGKGVADAIALQYEAKCCGVLSCTCFVKSVSLLSHSQEELCRLIMTMVAA